MACCLSIWEPVLGVQLTLLLICFLSKFMLHGRQMMELLLCCPLTLLVLLIESYLYDSFTTSGIDVSPYSSLSSFHFSLTDQQAYASLAYLLFHYCLSKAFPKHSLSLIFFLILNADFIDVCNSLDLLANGIGIVDDANVLAFGKGIIESCSILKAELILGEMHGASFAPHKYVHVHFPKKTQSLPITPVELSPFTFHPRPHVCVLGVILDSKLPRHPHIAHIKS